MLEFERKDKNVYVAFIETPGMRPGSIRLEAVRVQREGHAWRVDLAMAAGGSWFPWEALTDTAYKSMREAMDAAEKIVMDPRKKDGGSK